MAYENNDDYIDNNDNITIGSTTILPAIDAYLTSTISNLHNFIQNVTATANDSLLANDTGDTPYEEYKYRPETYMVPIMFSLIFVVGVVGNGTLIIVFIKHRAMRNVPNT